MTSPVNVLLEQIGNPAFGAYESLRLVQNSGNTPELNEKLQKFGLNPVSTPGASGIGTSVGFWEEHNI